MVSMSSSRKSRRVKNYDGLGTVFDLNCLRSSAGFVWGMALLEEGRAAEKAKAFGGWNTDLAVSDERQMANVEAVLCGTSLCLEQSRVSQRMNQAK